MRHLIRFTPFLLKAILLSAFMFAGMALFSFSELAADSQNPLDNHLPAGEISASQAVKTYDSIRPSLVENYAKSLLPVIVNYDSWYRYNTAPYVSRLHGDRLVNDYANSVAQNSGQFEEGGPLPSGAIIAMDSFKIAPSCLPLSITADAVEPGPLFVMEKMEPGFNTETGDWRFSMIEPNGTVYGETKGIGHDQVQFCADCHKGASADRDWLFFLPKEYRIRG